MTGFRTAVFATLSMMSAVLAGCESEPAGRPIVLRPPPPAPRAAVRHVARAAAPKPAERPAQAAPQGQQASEQTQRQAAGSDPSCAVEIARAKTCAAQQPQQQMSDTEKEELFRRFDSYLANQRERQ